MPVRDAVLTDPPAEVDPLALAFGGEVDEPALRVPQEDALARQAFELAAAAANDAVAAGVDQGRLRTTHAYILDPERTRAVVGDVVAASELASHLAGPPVVTVTGAGVRVELTLEADYIFADVIPGAPDGTVVTASATATAVSEPEPPAP